MSGNIVDERSIVSVVTFESPVFVTW